MRTLIITATILVPTVASAGGYLVPNMNPRDLALGGTAVADQIGPEAVSLNTADLSGQEGLSVSVGGAITNNRTDWSDPTLGPMGSAKTSQTATPPAVAVSYGEKLPFDQAWGIGVAFGTPGGGSLVWSQDGHDGHPWAGQEVVRSVKTQVFGIGVGAAFQLLPYFRAGLNYTRYQGDEEIHQALNFLNGTLGDAGLGLSGGGNTIGVSTEILAPWIPLKIGVSYVHSSTLSFSGHAHFSDVPPAYVPSLHDQTVHHDFLMPDVVQAGASYQILPGLTVMGSYQFEHWSAYKNDHFIGDGGFDAIVQRDYRNAYQVGGGGEWRNLPFLPQLTARVGVIRNVSDQRTDTIDPSLTDASRWGLSVGVGYDIMPSLRADVGYQHLIFDSVTANGMDNLHGTYTTAVDFVSLGVNWRTDLRGK
jgi:long-subunit fatty acid transport protein